MTGFEHHRIQECPDGPLLVRGEFSLLDADGVTHHTTRPISAVCRCGSTAIAPWCDGSHKLLKAKRAAGITADPAGPQITE